MPLFCAHWGCSLSENKHKKPQDAPERKQEASFLLLLLLGTNPTRNWHKKETKICSNISRAFFPQHKVMLFSSTVACNAAPLLSAARHSLPGASALSRSVMEQGMSSSSDLPSVRTGCCSDSKVILEGKSHSKKQFVLVVLGSAVPRFIPYSHFPRDWNSVLGQLLYVWAWFLK